MIEWIFVGAAFLLLALRLIRYSEVSVYHIMFEALAGIFMTMALYFFIFPAATVFISNTVITSGSAVTTAVTNATMSNAPDLGSNAPLIIYVFILIFDLFVVVLLINDIPPIFFRKSLPKTPGMPR